MWDPLKPRGWADAAWAYMPCEPGRPGRPDKWLSWTMLVKAAVTYLGPWVLDRTLSQGEEVASEVRSNKCGKGESGRRHVSLDPLRSTAFPAPSLMTGSRKLHSVPKTGKSSFPSQRTLVKFDLDSISTLLMTSMSLAFAQICTLWLYWHRGVGRESRSGHRFSSKEIVMGPKRGLNDLLLLSPHLHIYSLKLATSPFSHPREQQSSDLLDLLYHNSSSGPNGQN